MNTSHKSVEAYEAKAKLAELLEQAASGETITITKNDEPVARLVPARTPDRASWDSLFGQMDEIRERSALNPSGEPHLSIKQLIEEGRK